MFRKTMLLLAAAVPTTAHCAHPAHAGGEGLFDVLSATVPVEGSLSVAFTGAGYNAPADVLGQFRGKRTVIPAGLLLASGLSDRLEAWGRFNGVLYKEVERGHWPLVNSDGEVGAKLALPWGSRWLRTALAARLNLPWGHRWRGFSTDNFDPSLAALLTIPLPESNLFTHSSVHVNVGYRWRGDDRGRGFEDSPRFFVEPVYPRDGNDQLDLRGALEFGSERVTVFAEILLDQILSDALSFGESPIFLTPGVRLSVGRSYSLLLASKISLATDDEATDLLPAAEDFYPDWQLAFVLGWSRLGPGVDRDRDGIPDARDRCPREAEDLDGWEDQDGCPDPDNDGDGIPDEFDGAPLEAEDFDGFLDSDGIPDLDNDRDGVPDAQDICPLEAEDHDGVRDDDGCPEFDADGDGVPDADDECPEEAGPAEGAGRRGCPETAAAPGPELLPSIRWAKDEVPPEPLSFLELTGLAERLKENPDKVVEIRVIPAAGEGPGASRELARRRAEYLRGYLVAAGVRPAQVGAGVGERAELRELGLESRVLDPANPIVLVVPVQQALRR